MCIRDRYCVKKIYSQKILHSPETQNTYSHHDNSEKLQHSRIKKYRKMVYTQNYTAQCIDTVCQWIKECDSRKPGRKIAHREKGAAKEEHGPHYKVYNKAESFRAFEVGADHKTDTHHRY